MIFNRDKRPAVTATAEDVTTDPAVPDSLAVPVDLAAAAEQMSQEASAARDRAERSRAEAQVIVAGAEQEPGISLLFAQMPRPAFLANSRAFAASCLRHPLISRYG